MKEFETWNGLERVAAPAGFEDRIRRELDRRREDSRTRRPRLFKWAYTGAAAAAAIGLTALNLFIFKSGSPPFEGSVAAAAGEAIPIMESVQYHPEFMDAVSEPGTVYLLEQVSDASNSIIRY